ncbi:SDR family NAD(P)-dependent oxidoreductase [Mycolicibacterium sp.]|uniref:SDR family NAD(P)-dependent oxidoreductase n=1 Tax=Mycolicibacterium sp. TaxID=2320850 RepID=UPI0037C7BED7
MSGVLTGKRALITGAATGFGRATAELFAREGAHVVGMDLRFDDELDGVTLFQGDVTRDDDVATAVQTAAGDEGLDIVVANAGIILIDDLRTAKAQEWARVFDVNVLGMLRAFQAAAVNMIAAGREGKLLATASVSATRPYAEGGSYCASKAAVHSLVKSAALAFAGDGITVNAIDPGPADTALYRNAMAKLSQTDYASGTTVEEHKAESASHVPLKRLASTEEIAQLYLFLASDANSYMTGATIAVDGGLALV